MGFCNLHVHSEYSLLDSILKVEQIAKFAHGNHQGAIAITDHGYMHGFVEQVKACNKFGVKPIVGNEIYEVDDMYEMADTKDYKQPRYHLVLLAKNNIGLKNLFKITSLACTAGMYKKPRISIDIIKENHWGEGIICLTACQAGRLSKMLCSDNYDKAVKHYNNLKSTFDYVACEIQSHPTDAQIDANKRIVAFAEAIHSPIVVTTDAHMLSADDAESHSIFVQIGEGREVGESYSGCYLQTESDVLQTLGDTPTIRMAIQESCNIADMIEDVDIGLNNPNQMPIINIPHEYSSHEEYLRHLIYSTFDEKFGYMSKEEQQIRRDRIEMELPVLVAVDYVDYFIMVYMLLNEARKRKIPLGYGRGSAAGCLCLFMLNVTQIDSVKWDLDFSRFANMGRRSMADIDIDISKSRRKEVIDISMELFGKDNVAPICTFNTLSTKVAIRDIGKVLNETPSSPYYEQIPFSLRASVSNAIPTIKTLDDLGEEVEKETALKDLLSGNDALQEVYAKFPKWFEYVMRLEGLVKSRGRHAAGTLITPKPVVEYAPTCYDKDKNVVLQLEMHAAMDDLKCIKMDFLGLKQLDTIENALKSANVTWQDVDINNLNLADERVFKEIYLSGNTVGIFQMEGAEARQMCIDANTNDIETIIATNAFDRPGTKMSFPEYCKNKADPASAVVLHEDLKQIFSKTNYILLYQEQALAMFRYAGFPEEEVDGARRCIGKKDKVKMSSLEVKMRKGLIAKGWNDTQIDGIWALLLKQAEYSFGRAHACAYGLLSYLTAYLKAHYPVEYMSACLTADSGNVSRIGILIHECKRMGIEVLPPMINKSNLNFTPMAEQKQILFGFLAIKGIGESAIQNILSKRPYTTFKDFISKIQDKSSTIALIKSGAFAIDQKSKEKLLNMYAMSLYDQREYKPVQSYGTKAALMNKYSINADDYKDGKKIDKERLLADYNAIRKTEFDHNESSRKQVHLQEFKDKYMQEPWKWEYDSLSMFVTHDPLEFAWQYLSDWDEVKNNSYTAAVGVILSIQKKKDKHGQPYCHVNLYTPYGIVEATCWSRQTKKYLPMITVGNVVAVYGDKAEQGHLFVEEIKTYKEWLEDRKILHEGVNG